MTHKTGLMVLQRFIGPAKHINLFFSSSAGGGGGVFVTFNCLSLSRSTSILICDSQFVLKFVAQLSRISHINGTGHFGQELLSMWTNYLLTTTQC